MELVQRKCTRMNISFEGNKTYDILFMVIHKEANIAEKFDFILHESLL